MEEIRTIEILPKGTILISGGGPVGLVLALVLAHHGQRSVLIEQNIEATRYPKMHLVIARTMEIFRQLGIADELRSKGVAEDEPFTVRFSSGFGSAGSLSTWDLPSVEAFRQNISLNNDGTMPREPWARIPSNIMEPWLREKCDANPLIDTRYGWAVEGLVEYEDTVEVHVHDRASNIRKTIRSPYVVGCDGAWSAVRKGLGAELEGGPMHRAVALTHFKSKDLERLHRQGRFWHTFFPTDPTTNNGSVGGAIIAQDGKETWTVHDYLGSDYNADDVTAEKTVARVLGGMGSPYPISIDEVTATSIFTPTVALAETWSGKHQRVFLAGDACHQTIPSGGYGMNMGLADAWDLGWKLAATVQGWGGTHLMKTYEQERRPVAALMQHWSKIHMMKLMGLSTAVKLDPVVIESMDERGIALREEIDQYIQQNDDHNQSFGVEMGHRYESSLAVLNEQVDVEKAAPQFDSRNYIPTTFPGSRVPHVALSDGSAISDGFGKGFTMVAFLQKEAVAAGDQFQVPIALASFEEAARQHSIPLKSLCLMNETHAFRIWDACLVLVRPDGFSAWRSDSLDKVHNASQVLLQAAGHTSPL
ncbi:monooxygenase [Penicillium desertorum]|uniref:Monooxygenase n=1 Tax=Penicillium desertorum TaxID=1303715 RepID=A0A9X0BH92_9EURO|nr:monooxygenase [Penicillium desertorum]